MYLLQVIWKTLYSHSSRDHGTLGYFQSLLNRYSVKNPKKEVDASIDFLLTVVKGHFLACACKILGITSLNSRVALPPQIYKATIDQQWAYITSIAKQVVYQCTLIGETFVNGKVIDSGDHVYNYARVLCHYGALVMEFRDGWGEGDGERSYRCWRLLLPHFIVAGRTKYSLEALRLQIQVKSVLSPQLAHHIMWDRFVNTHGRAGRNIPCDLYNEHVNKLLKHIIVTMGANLTEKALHRAAQSVTTLESICKRFDQQSGVPVGTHAHSTRSDKQDITKVMNTVLTRELLEIIPGRAHTSFKRMRLNPLWNWDISKTREWIEKKKKQFLMFRGAMRPEDSEESSFSDNDSECEED